LFHLLGPQRKGLEFCGWVRRIKEDYDQHSGDPESLAYDETFFYEHLNPDPLFVACTFDLSEIATALVNMSWNLNCGQAAAVYNSTGALKVILDTLQEGQNLQATYLHSLVIEASSARSIQALRDILIRAGNGFIVSDYLCRLIRKLNRRHKQLNENVLRSLIEANSELRITEVVFEAAFKCQTMRPPNLGALSMLLIFTDGIELTRRLVNTALCNFRFTSDIMLTILHYKGPLYISPEVLSFMFSRRNSL
jgi:hypothetical protein